MRWLRRRIDHALRRFLRRCHAHRGRRALLHGLINFVLGLGRWRRDGRCLRRSWSHGRFGKRWRDGRLQGRLRLGRRGDGGFGGLLDGELRGGGGNGGLGGRYGLGRGGRRGFDGGGSDARRSRSVPRTIQCLGRRTRRGGSQARGRRAWRRRRGRLSLEEVFEIGDRGRNRRTRTSALAKPILLLFFLLAQLAKPLFVLVLQLNQSFQARRRHGFIGLSSRPLRSPTLAMSSLTNSSIMSVRDPTAVMPRRWHSLTS